MQVAGTGQFPCSVVNLSLTSTDSMRGIDATPQRCSKERGGTGRHAPGRLHSLASAALLVGVRLCPLVAGKQKASHWFPILITVFLGCLSVSLVSEGLYVLDM